MPQSSSSLHLRAFLRPCIPLPSQSPSSFSINNAVVDVVDDDVDDSMLGHKTTSAVAAAVDDADVAVYSHDDYVASVHSDYDDTYNSNLAWVGAMDEAAGIHCLGVEEDSKEVAVQGFGWEDCLDQRAVLHVPPMQKKEVYLTWLLPPSS